MQARIQIQAPDLARTVTVNFNAKDYHEVILEGRNRVVKRARGFLLSERQFMWVTQYRSRAMRWVIVEMGFGDSEVIRDLYEQSISSRRQEVASLHGMREREEAEGRNIQPGELEFPGQESSPA